MSDPLSALIAAAAALGGVWVGGYFNTKRARETAMATAALQSAITDFQTLNDLMRWRKERGEPVANVEPFPVFLFLHTELLKLAEAGKLDAASIREVQQDTAKLSVRLRWPSQTAPPEAVELAGEEPHNE